MKNAIFAFIVLFSVTGKAQRPYVNEAGEIFWETAMAGNTEAVKKTNLATIADKTIAYAAKEAASHGWIEMLEFLLTAEMFDPKAFREDPYAPVDMEQHKQWLVHNALTDLLWSASKEGQIESMQVLFMHGAKTEGSDAGSDFVPTPLIVFVPTPLMAAATNGQVDAVKLLLSKGADPEAIYSPSEHTAYDFAYENGHTEVMRIEGLRVRSKYIPDWFPLLTRERAQKVAYRALVGILGGSIATIVVVPAVIHFFSRPVVILRVPVVVRIPVPYPVQGAVA